MSNNTARPTYEEFLRSFAFTYASGDGRKIGVEREFLLHYEDKPDPHADAFLERMALYTEDGGEAWTYELSRCQVEHRTRPHRDLLELRKDLAHGSSQGGGIAAFMQRELRGIEVGPADMTLETYPDPRYAEIAKALGEERLRAACRVAGVHVHVQCFGPEDAVHVYNTLRAQLPKLIQLGDHSDGERMRLYGMVVNNLHHPPHIESFEHLYRLACETGWANNPRGCWWTIRISRHGTVEVRVFGATDRIDEVMAYVEAVLQTIR